MYEDDIKDWTKDNMKTTARETEIRWGLREAVTEMGATTTYQKL